MSPLPISDKTAIVGIGYTPMVRKTDQPVRAVAAAAALDAIKDAGLKRDDIDGYIGCPDAPNASALQADGVDQVSAGLMIETLGLKQPRWFLDIQARPTGAVVAAAQALYAGMCNYVLVLRCMYNPTDVRYPESSRTHVPGPEQFLLPYGFGGAGGHHAPRLARYMHKYGATREELSAIARNARRNAQMNPHAVWHGRGELTLEEYMSARWIYEPMCLFDCDMPVTGAGAVIVTTAKRARDMPHRPALLTAYANALQPGASVFEQAGISPRDVQVAQIYDGYSLFVWEWLERLGFCGEGEAHTYASFDRIGAAGELPLNTFGGNLGEGRLHGTGHLREAVIQAMDRGGERQVPNVQHSLVAAGGIPNDPHVLLLRAG